jgi:hypothetical protein
MCEFNSPNVVRYKQYKICGIPNERQLIRES